MSKYVPYSRRNPSVRSPDAPLRARLFVEPGPRDEFRRQAFRNLDISIGRRKQVGFTRVSSTGERFYPDVVWAEIVEKIEHELGIDLSRRQHDTARETFASWFFDSQTPMSYFLSGLEISLLVVAFRQPEISEYLYQAEYLVSLSIDQLVEDTNDRLRQWDIPYSIDPGTYLISKNDSEYIHAEVVTPRCN